MSIQGVAASSSMEGDDIYSEFTRNAEIVEFHKSQRSSGNLRKENTTAQVLMLV